MNYLERLLARVHPKPASTATPRQPVDARIATIINDALAAAGLQRGNRQAGSVETIIDGALTRAGLRGPGIDPTGMPAPPSASPSQSPSSSSLPGVSSPAAGVPLSAPPDAASGQFIARSFAGPAGTLAYKLYLPAGYDVDTARSYPLLVMLHGCTQSPDDFAAGTRMNELADQHGLLVAYPAQSANANGSKCWNWFRPQDQGRGQGEPALIAGLTAQLCSEHRVDAARVYVAGLSAGAAMAVILGRTYPDTFAAVGAHSGLPYRAANDVGSAFAAMKGGARTSQHAAAEHLVPTIVFHGDKDSTVSAANGDGIIRQLGGAGLASLRKSADEPGLASGGRRYTRTRYTDDAGRSVVEDWRVHGAGHAWMGGSKTGTYTDPLGPDASVEMLRFFLQHAR